MNDIDLSFAGVGIEHHFSSGVYAKDTRIPAGIILIQHSHPYDHLSILASGKVILNVDGKDEVITGPACLNIKKGTEHSVTALTDSVWYCIHKIEDDNPATVDESILNAAH